MVTNRFGNRTFMQPMGRLSMHSKCLDFFPFKFWVGVGERGEDLSHQVPNVFPKGVLNSTSLNPICFAQKSSPSLLYIGGPKGLSISSFHRIFYFGELS
jgi:hypothetical protein